MIKIIQNTIDELMWKVLQKKWAAVSSTLDGVSEKYDATAFTPEENSPKPKVNAAIKRKNQKNKNLDDLFSKSSRNETDETDDVNKKSIDSNEIENDSDGDKNREILSNDENEDLLNSPTKKQSELSGETSLEFESGDSGMKDQSARLGKRSSSRLKTTYLPIIFKRNTCSKKVNKIDLLPVIDDDDNLYGGTSRKSKRKRRDPNKSSDYDDDYSNDSDDDADSEDTNSDTCKRNIEKKRRINLNDDDDEDDDRAGSEGKTSITAIRAMFKSEQINRRRLI